HMILDGDRSPHRHDGCDCAKGILWSRCPLYSNKWRLDETAGKPPVTRCPPHDVPRHEAFRTEEWMPVAAMGIAVVNHRANRNVEQIVNGLATRNARHTPGWAPRDERARSMSYCETEDEDVDVGVRVELL